ncbi:hypothetical protein FF38_08410 [Lucilia cuprina]|uniref:Uncharacterized protein n=1 Tax=Lucilia cuprina TaxID=7375 RepID=A0A0L0BPZ1_LUCCU|nr:hypothetical protein FF38_08410 [Lucilia cuprina]
MYVCEYVGLQIGPMNNCLGFCITCLLGMAISRKIENFDLDYFDIANDQGNATMNEDHISNGFREKLMHNWNNDIETQGFNVLTKITLNVHHHHSHRRRRQHHLVAPHGTIFKSLCRYNKINHFTCIVSTILQTKQVVYEYNCLVKERSVAAELQCTAQHSTVSIVERMWLMFVGWINKYTQLAALARFKSHYI